jgi:channel protein (hemolysin III family)
MLGIGLIQRAYGNRLRVAAVGIYVSGVVFALTASGLFHLLGHDTAARDLLQKLDHAGIFFLIAASYTPIHVIEFRGFWRWGILTIVWSAALAGMLVKLLFFTAIPDWVSLMLYLSLGWAGLVSATLLYRAVGLAPLRPLIGGALAYTLGAIMEFAEVPTLYSRVFGPHEFFHLLVLMGVALHWTYIRRVVVAAPITDLYQRRLQPN